MPILPRFLASETYSPWAISWRCLHDPMYSRLDTILACDRHTQTHDNGVYRTSIVSSSKNPIQLFPCLFCGDIAQPGILVEREGCLNEGGKFIVNDIVMLGHCDSKFTCGRNSRQCYTSKQRCDGINNCDHRTDELHCSELVTWLCLLYTLAHKCSIWTCKLCHV